MRRRRRRLLSDEDAEFLEREFGSVKKGIKEIIDLYKRSLGPEEPSLRTAWHALLQASEAEGRMEFKDALEVVCKALNCAKEKAYSVLQELSAKGFISTVETGWIVVGQRRLIPRWLAR